MAKQNAIQNRRRIAAASGFTTFRSDFNYICKRHPERIGILCEGDSWFAYPRKWIAFGADINIVHHITEVLAHSNTANVLQMASNGDEAVNMMSGKQKEIFENVLKQNADKIKLILFSGGGNDIVGKRDMPEILNQYQQGFGATDCINHVRFAKKLDAIMLAYDTLVDLRDRYVPHAKIVTHSYDLAQPSPVGAEFFWGLIKTKPWIYPYLVEKQIPAELHKEIVDILLGTFKTLLEAFTQQPEHLDKIYLIDTQGILRPGNDEDWLNEIHPTETGFKKIAQPIYAKLLRIYPQLPAWK